MNAGLYTHMNIGATQVQWTRRVFESTARGISFSIAALPTANSSHALDSMAFEVSRVRTSDLAGSALYGSGPDNSGSSVGATCTAEVTP